MFEEKTSNGIRDSRPSLESSHLEDGQRITIDCATLMNKGFEVIEACWLFGFAPSQVDVAIHPQSTVHAMIEYSDGSVLAQISPTDMRIPIRRTDGNPYIGSYKNAWNGAVHNSSAPALVDEIILDTRPKLERIIASGQDAAAMTCNPQ